MEFDLSDLEVDVVPADGVKCERCRRYTPWNVPGVDICGRCRDVGIEDGWLTYDPDTAIFSRTPDWSRDAE